MKLIASKFQPPNSKAISHRVNISLYTTVTPQQNISSVFSVIYKLFCHRVDSDAKKTDATDSRINYHLQHN